MSNLCNRPPYQKGTKRKWTRRKLYCKRTISTHLADLLFLAIQRGTPKQYEKWLISQPSAIDGQMDYDPDAGLTYCDPCHFRTAANAGTSIRATNKMRLMARLSQLSLLDRSPAPGGAVMAKPLVSDELWNTLQPMIPPRKPRRFRYPGRKPIDDRKALTGILFVLKTGIRWEDLPTEMGCGCGMTCWRRLRDWNEAGVWPRLHQVLLQRLDDAHLINWTRAAIDSTFARAFEGVEGSGKNPTDRGRPGVKQHILVDANGVPLAGDITPANVPEVKELLPLVESCGPQDEAGEPQRRPEKLYADRAYDSEPHREELRKRGMEPKFAKRRTEHGSGLGVFRWVAERTISWLHGFRKLRLVTEKTQEMQFAFFNLALALICFRFL